MEESIHVAGGVLLTSHIKLNVDQYFNLLQVSF